MELNKYDLVDWLTSHIKDIPCGECPIQKECDECGKIEDLKGVSYLCLYEDKTREMLIKKYNL